MFPLSRNVLSHPGTTAQVGWALPTSSHHADTWWAQPTLQAYPFPGAPGEAKGGGFSRNPRTSTTRRVGFAHLNFGLVGKAHPTARRITSHHRSRCGPYISWDSAPITYPGES